MNQTLFKPVNQKLREAVIFILKNIEFTRDMGMKKLAKLLYFADFNFYKKNNVSITNEDYLRWEFGPVPKNIYNVMERLESEGIISISKVRLNDEVYKYDFKILKKIDLKYLSDEEKKQIKRVITKLGSLSASNLENLSHRDTPWQVTDTNKPINYKLVFYRDNNLIKVIE